MNIYRRLTNNILLFFRVQDGVTDSKISPWVHPLLQSTTDTMEQPRAPSDPEGTGQKFWQTL